MDSENREGLRKRDGASFGTFFAIFLLLAAGIVLVGWSNFRRERADLERDRKRDLEAVAGLKVGQITNWRADQLHLAQTLKTGFLANEAVAGLLAEASPAALARLETWLGSLVNSKEFLEVLLFDAGGEVRAASAADREAGAHAAATVAQAMAAGEPVISDLHRKTSGGSIHIDLAVPLLARAGEPPVAALLFRIDPGIFLFPLIQSWPVPSATAETLIVRRDGDDVLFLNELRHRPGTALLLRAPLDRPDLPSAKAARGDYGAHYGLDYRGVPVLSVGLAVPGSPWSLVAKIDTSEAFGPLRARALGIALASLALILAAGAFLSYLWRDREARAARRQAEADERHRALLDRYRHLASEANDAILLLDGRGKVLEANERAVRLFGRPRGALVGTLIDDLRAAGAPSDPREILRRIEAEGGGLYESLYARGDGVPVPVEVSARGVEIGGEIVFQYLIRDITERKERERRVADSLAFNRRLLEALPVGIITFKAHGACVVANPALARMAGGTVEDILRLDYRKIDSFRRSGVRDAIEAALATGAERSLEAKVVSAFGQEFWFSCRLVPFTYEGETHILGLFQNIAEQRRAEESLKESEERYRAFFENSLDAVLLTDPAGAILEANPSACRVFGRTEEELRALGRTGVVDMGDARVAEAVAERARTGRFRGELTFIRADGSRFPGELSSAIFIDPQGRPRSSMIIRDVTDRRQAEEDLKRQRELLRRLAAHLQSVREDERTQVSREIHDELGQALTGLKFDLAWLRKRTEEEGLADKIVSMEALLDATIEWARRLSMRLRPGLLDDLGLIPALDWLARDLQGRTGIEASFDAGPLTEAAPIGRDEATALFRVCQESLTNVAKHAGAKRVRISLRKEAGRLALEVRDDGRGVTPDDLAKTASFGIQGMRERAAALGGEFRAEGAPGGGTVVTIAVPLREGGPE